MKPDNQLTILITQDGYEAVLEKNGQGDPAARAAIQAFRFSIVSDADFAELSH